MTESKILLALPSYDGRMCVELVPFLMEAAGKCRFYPILRKPTDVARNLAASLARRTASHLMMVDSDASPAPGTFEALKAKVEQEVCVAAVPYVSPGGQICVGEQSPNVKDVEHLEGWHPADNFGTHCCVIHAEVFEKVPMPFFEYTYNNEHSTAYGEDTVFGRKVKAAAIPIYIDYSHWAGHVVTKTMEKPRSLTEIEKALILAGS